MEIEAGNPEMNRNHLENSTNLWSNNSNKYWVEFWIIRRIVHKQKKSPTTTKTKPNNNTFIVKNNVEKAWLLKGVTVSTNKNSSLKKFEKLSNFKDLEIEMPECGTLESMSICNGVEICQQIYKGNYGYQENKWKKGGGKNQTNKKTLIMASHILPKFFFL